MAEYAVTGLRAYAIGAVARAEPTRAAFRRKPRLLVLEARNRLPASTSLTLTDQPGPR